MTVLLNFNQFPQGSKEIYEATTDFSLRGFACQAEKARRQGAAAAWRGNVRPPVTSHRSAAAPARLMFRKWRAGKDGRNPTAAVAWQGKFLISPREAP
jgi:hypothetical protein